MVFLKPIGALMGLATEAVAHNKEKTQEAFTREHSPGPAVAEAPPSTSREISQKDTPASGESILDSDSDTDIEDDHKTWALDDAAAEFEHSDSSPPTDEPSHYDEVAPVDQVIFTFKELHPAAFRVHEKDEIPLPYPVILPQRQPKDRRRGFVRAYAPLLGECKGIDQDTFMRFLKDFDMASRVRESTRRQETESDG